MSSSYVSSATTQRQLWLPTTISPFLNMSRSATFQSLILASALSMPGYMGGELRI